MAQHDFDLANAITTAWRSDLNNGLDALVSCSSGAAEPPAPFAGMFWFDTSTNLLKQRNEANDGWLFWGAHGASGFIPYKDGSELVFTLTDPELRTNLVHAWFQILTNAALSMTQMVDGFVDAFEDQSGVDEPSSSGFVYDASNDLYHNGGGSPPAALSLVSTAVAADSAPSSVDVILEIEEVDALTLNTDLKVFATIESGSPLTWVQGTLTEEVVNGSPAVKILQASDINVSAQSGTACRYKIETANDKEVKILSAAMLWG